MATYRVTWISRNPIYQPICFRDFPHFPAASWFAGKISDTLCPRIMRQTEPFGPFESAPETEDGADDPSPTWTPYGPSTGPAA